MNGNKIFSVSIKVTASNVGSSGANHMLIEYGNVYMQIPRQDQRRRHDEFCKLYRGR
jgi:hypothetical protein